MEAALTDEADDVIAAVINRLAWVTLIGLEVPDGYEAVRSKRVSLWRISLTAWRWD